MSIMPFVRDARRAIRETKTMLEEFKKFALRGNVVDLAVGVIIGAAFGAIVASLVGDIIMPIIGMLAARFGRRNHYVAAIALFTITSMLCGLARSLPVLVLFRILQGLGLAAEAIDVREEAPRPRREQHLDGDQAVERELSGPVHDPHPALAEDALNIESGDLRRPLQDPVIAGQALRLRDGSGRRGR